MQVWFHTPIKRTSICLLLATLCSGCLQKHCVSIGAAGIVLDSHTQSPLGGAAVSVPGYTGKARPVTTGADGRFSIEPRMHRDFVFLMGDFAPPATTLVVERQGYLATNINLATTQTNFVAVALTPSHDRTDSGFTWGTSPGLPSFGSPSPDSIRVAVIGFSVRSGHYLLPRGATVRDAMEAAQFSGFVGWEYPYSGIQRKRQDGLVETRYFTRQGRAADERRVLQDDDRLSISHEVY
jgi:hypothetical protein